MKHLISVVIMLMTIRRAAFAQTDILHVLLPWRPLNSNHRFVKLFTAKTGTPVIAAVVTNKLVELPSVFEIR
jgi:hypothetical protein